MESSGKQVPKDGTQGVHVNPGCVSLSSRIHTLVEKQTNKRQSKTTLTKERKFVPKKYFSV